MFDLSSLNTGALRLVTTRHGPFVMIEADRQGIGALLTYYGEFCEHEIRLLQALMPQDGFMIEVGCNIGSHTIPMARHLGSKGGRLVAYEAQPVIALLLRTNLALNGLTGVEVHVSAAGSAAGYCVMPVTNYLETLNSGAFTLKTNSLSDSCIAIEPLDALERSRPVDLIKIDVEGMEIDVLLGAQAIISEDRPLVYFEHEHNSGVYSLEPFTFFEGKDYRLFFDVKELHDARNFNGRHTPFFGNIGSSSNVLAVPAERVDGLADLLAAMKLTAVQDPLRVPLPVAP